VALGLRNRDATINRVARVATGKRLTAFLSGLATLFSGLATLFSGLATLWGGLATLWGGLATLWGGLARRFTASMVLRSIHNIVFVMRH